MCVLCLAIAPNRILKRTQKGKKWAQLGKCSHDTALRDIQALIDSGVLRLDASGGRSTSYSLVD